MESQISQGDNNFDNHVDEQINACLDLDNPKSFFLFAGAGSGKTRSLVKVLKEHLIPKYNRRLILNGKKIAVITYTNAACDEIKQRLDFNPLIEVSTIHSFVWSLIKGLHYDIRKWLSTNLMEEIKKLEEQQKKGRAGTKAAIDREYKINSKTARLSGLEEIKEFTYNPNTDNRGKDSLSHSEVTKISAYFLENKSLMQSILINKHPVLLIDESQDTNKDLMNAFMKVQELYSQQFSLGLLGDTMQRVYTDGKIDLGVNLPPDWETPVKKMNHRSGKRIVTLINKIRADIDTKEQKPRSDKNAGVVRLFILPSNTSNKPQAEDKIINTMSAITSDTAWNRNKDGLKVLTLEHHMAALRLHFLEMFTPLYKEKSKRLKTGLLDGTLPTVGLFSKNVLPLIIAKRENDEFQVSNIVRNKSPLLSKDAIKKSGNDQSVQIKKAREAIDALLSLWANDKKPRFIDVLLSINQTGLFDIPQALLPIVNRSNNFKKDESSDIENSNSIIDAYDEFLQAPFEQVEPYDKYVNGLASFDTHQGVKGLEFPRVMVIIDDSDAGGFLFSYEKLFGAVEESEKDRKNELEGKDTTVNRTRRLFYVACSRAESSLAIVAYSSNPERVKDNAISNGWFESNEIKIIH